MVVVVFTTRNGDSGECCSALHTRVKGGGIINYDFTSHDYQSNNLSLQ